MSAEQDGSNAAAEKIRCSNDRRLFAALLDKREVRHVNDQIEAHEREGPVSLRRRLLASSVRLSRRMGPAVHAMADECRERLGLTIPVELFVYPGPQFNAACFKPEHDRLYVIFSSSLLEGFSGSELRFVVGHELGHHLYRHHDIPIGHILRGRTRPTPKLALTLFTWSRYAEISADRAGAFCADDLEGVARALFRLASGLSGSVIQFSLDDFLKQVDEMQVEDAQPGQGAPEEDWFATHPFSPLRTKALQLFHQSALMATDGLPADQLEVAVQGLMALMEPSYLDGRTDAAESMRRLLFAGAIAVANADQEIDASEIEAFEEFFGTGTFTPSLDIAQLEADLPARIEQAMDKTSEPQRAQVLRDLCLIANGEEECAPAELQVLYRISDGLGIGREFVTRTLSCDLEPD